MSDLLKVQGLCKAYPTFKLTDVSFSLPKGYIMGFIGPNGAGKTTTIKSILSMIRPDSGTIELLGQQEAQARQALRERIGVVMDAPFYSSDWTAVDVEKGLRPFYSRWDSAAFHHMLERYGLDPRKKVKELSRGMKVKLMTAVALSHDAQLLILDEPTSGLDPVARDELMEALQTFIADGQRSVLFSTHITSDLEKVADFITYILAGRIVFTGEKDTLLERYCIARGGPQELTAQLKGKLIGLREHSHGFEGLLPTDQTGGLPPTVTTEQANMDEIIVFMNRSVHPHE